MTIRSRHPGLAIGALALIAAVALVPQTAAHAAPLGAMARCLAGLTADQTETVTHWGSQPATSFPDIADAPNAIWPGDVVKVTAIGSISNAPWPAGWFGPAGNTIPAGPEFPYPGMNEYASIANWNNNPAGWVGPPMPTVSLAACTYAPAIRVRLVYHLNDFVLWDNRGAFTITTRLYFGS